MNDRDELIADLDALDALFADASKWTQFSLGRLCDGTPTRDVFAACRWCISGGALRVTPTDSRWRALLDTLADVKKLLADARSMFLLTQHKAP
jgi:hypothetical protein